MISKYMLALLFSILFINSIATNTNAIELTATIQVKVYSQTAPTEVLVVGPTCGEVNCKKSSQINSQFFICDVSFSKSDELYHKFTLLACWEDMIEQLYLRIPEFTLSEKEKKNYRIYHNIPSANVETIEKIDKRGEDLISSYMTYFDARHIYRKMKQINLKHTVTIRAARLWLDAAYRLAGEKNLYIDMDEEAIKENSNMTMIAAKDEKFLFMFSKVNRPGYIETMAGRGITVRWTDVGIIPELISTGQLDDADRVNSYYLKLYDTLPEKNRENIRKWYGVNSSLLQNNASYIKALK